MKEKLIVGSILIFSLIIRFILLPWGWDLEFDFLTDRKIPSNVILSGGLIYRDCYFAYPPFLAYLDTVFLLVTPFRNNMHIENLLVKAPIQIFEVIACYYLYLLIKNISSMRKALLGLISYSFFPNLLLISAFQGRWDSFVASTIIISLFYFNKANAKQKQRYYILSSLFLGLGIASKLIPILLCPISVFNRKEWIERLKYLIFSLMPLFITSFPFLILCPNAFFSDVLFFQTSRAPGDWEVWGFTFARFLRPEPIRDWLVPSWNYNFEYLWPIVLLFPLIIAYFMKFEINKHCFLILFIFTLFTKYMFPWYMLWWLPLGFLDVFTANRYARLKFSVIFIMGLMYLHYNVCSFLKLHSLLCILPHIIILPVYFSSAILYLFLMVKERNY